MKKEQGNLNYVAMEEQVLKFWKDENIFSKNHKNDIIWSDSLQ